MLTFVPLRVVAQRPTVRRGVQGRTVSASISPTPSGLLRAPRGVTEPAGCGGICLSPRHWRLPGFERGVALLVVSEVGIWCALLAPALRAGSVAPCDVSR